MQKQILCFLPGVGTDGITKIMMDLYSQFDKDYYNIEIMTFKIEDTIFVKENYKIHELCKNIFRRYLQEYSIIKQNQYDIVHVNGNIFSRFLECMIAKLGGTKRVIIHSHNTGSSNLSKVKRILNKCLKSFFIPFCDVYLTCSDLAARWLFPKKIIESKKVIKINNGIETDKFIFNDEIRTKYRKNLNIENKLVIGHIGRFEEQKNHEFLIDVFKKVYQKNNNSVLILIGVGKLQEKIRYKVKELGLENSILFLNQREDINNLFMAMDVFVLPSKFEGFPIVLVEAQMSGINVFLSDTITSEAKINDNVEFLSLQEDVEDWADIILNHSKDYDRTKCIKPILNCDFDIKNSAKKLEQLYFKILN